MSLYDELKSLGVEMEHHESDLYVKSTPEVDAIVTKSIENGLAAYKFRSQIDNYEIWWDIFGAYDPFWESKQKEITP